MGRIFRIFVSGALALLPIMVTVLVTAWLGSLVATFAGPGSFLGTLITSLGLNISSSYNLAYFLGLGIIGLSQGGIVPSYAVIVREYMPAREAGERIGVIMAS
ncbi:MAG: hypothetical protein AAF405_06220, partial [Pseudomonadota bacterium]